MRILDLCEREPLSRRNYLRDQMERAALSVAANIVEGNGRTTPKDYALFLDRARGSAVELHYWISVCTRRDWLPHEDGAALSAEIEQLSAMLLAMSRTMRRNGSLASRDPSR